MPFFPDSLFGLAYLAGLCLAGLAVLCWPDRNARKVFALLAGHWVTMRMVDAVDHSNALAWVLHDGFFIASLLIIGRSKLAYAIAALFVPVMIFDQVWLLWGSTFEANAAVAEAAGYISMLMIAGVAHDGTHGNRLGRMGRYALGGYGFRRRNGLVPLAGWRSISRRSGVSGEGLEGGGFRVPGNSGAQS